MPQYPAKSDIDGNRLRWGRISGLTEGASCTLDMNAWTAGNTEWTKFLTLKRHSGGCGVVDRPGSGSCLRETPFPSPCGQH